MKRYFVFVVMLVVFSQQAYSQGNRATDRKQMERIEAARIGMITERLNLSTNEAERFWPIYNEFTTQRREIRQRLTNERQGIDPKNLTEEQSQRLMDLSLELRQQEINLERDFSQRLRDVIPAQKIIALRKAEEDFRNMLLQRLQEQQRRRMERERMMRQQENQRQRGNN